MNFYKKLVNNIYLQNRILDLPFYLTWILRFENFIDKKAYLKFSFKIIYFFNAHLEVLTNH